jgi:hypothetical protein
MLANPRFGVSPSWRIQSPMNPLTASLRRKPRHSIVLPAKSAGTVLVSVENASGLVAVRSSLADHRPPCTMAPSTETVPGGPPLQPAGTAPLCADSKASVFSSSGSEPPSWAWPATANTTHIKAADARLRLGRLVTDATLPLAPP